MKFIYSVFMSVVLVFLLFSVQSCQCPCDDEVVAEFICQPREITISEFVSDLIDSEQSHIEELDDENMMIQKINYYPVDSYSIHTFKFPNNTSSTGSLPNDPRLNSDNGTSKIPIVKIPVSLAGPNIPFFIAFLGSTPPNEDIVGDILVESVDLQTNPLEPTAQLKFAGSLYRISDAEMPSESSRDYCEEIEAGNYADEDRIQNEYRPNLIKYGNNDNPYTYQMTDMVIINHNNQVIARRTTVGWEFRTMLIGGVNYYFLNEVTRNKLANDFNNINVNKANDELQALLAEKSNVRTEVSIGNTFFYRAVNGRDFIMSIINISEKQLGTAYKKRVSIMFNEL